MRFFLPFSILFTPWVSAVSIIKPAANSTYAAGSTVTVNWDTVDTDPAEISLYLWNFVSWPPSYTPLAVNVPTVEQSYSVKIPCDTAPEQGYQISAINGTNVYIIYAQGEHFTISNPVNGTRCADPVPSPSTCPPSAAASTVYITVSPTGSSSRLLHPSSSGSPSTHASPTPSLTTVSSTSKYVKPGIVPKTIGWCSDYSHPVTLDKIPTPTDAPHQPTSVDGGKVVTITTTVSVAGTAGEGSCAFI
ncbi:Ser-Thr-rich glycosyl-phosphatidyl-inositol-anchored membrane family-domain-containing protein [Aspergillus avenaceus]|uniref:Ser-Thr-rich glycosyl-phosphatidyl-inositol-anchored membrane family-domain-containing protein n=1 Tax=Aspergillus avenaceus TaxID=36643 RepID=A0A5N6TZR1_ASPAV|nr:Ser-Thr-rich glycosyl-phosphatidyl-inositol-anchored membrane family-domain-containing protein [Aspergillus avenaceus]